jgi:hypothetical protein
MKTAAAMLPAEPAKLNVSALAFRELTTPTSAAKTTTTSVRVMDAS